MYRNWMNATKNIIATGLLTLTLGIGSAIGQAPAIPEEQRNDVTEAGEVVEEGVKPEVLPVGSLIVPKTDAVIEAVKKRSKVDLRNVATRGGSVVVDRGAEINFTLLNTGAVSMNDYSDNAIDGLKTFMVAQILKRIKGPGRLLRGAVCIPEHARLGSEGKTGRDQRRH